MVSAAAVRAQVETVLSSRVPGAFTLKARQAPELFPTGIVSIDELLDGGIPRGNLTEITGAASTGRTALALSVVAGATSRGAACAWVDTHDALSPESAAACGVDLRYVLWLRAGARYAEEILQQKPATETRSGNEPEHPVSSSGCTHPRNESRNMDRAVSLLFKGREGLLRDKSIGTPGAANLPMSGTRPRAIPAHMSELNFTPRCSESLPHRRKEQVSSDRLPPRRGEAVLKQQRVAPADRADVSTVRMPKWQRGSKEEKPWSRLDQSLRATDLLMQAGGFSVIVLDLCDVRPEQLMRIPMTTFYRFRLAAEKAQTAFVLLTQLPIAKSCSALLLHCEAPEKCAPWSAATDERRNQTALFEGLTYGISVERNRSEYTFAPGRKKPSASERASWATHTRWVR